MWNQLDLSLGRCWIKPEKDGISLWELSSRHGGLVELGHLFDSEQWCYPPASEDTLLLLWIMSPPLSFFSFYKKIATKPVLNIHECRVLFFFLLVWPILSRAYNSTLHIVSTINTCWISEWKLVWNNGISWYMVAKWIEKSMYHYGYQCWDST